MIVDLKTLRGRQLDAAFHYLWSKDYVQGRFISHDGDASAAANAWCTSSHYIVELLDAWVMKLENTSLAEWVATSTGGYTASGNCLEEAVVRVVAICVNDGSELELPDEVIESHSDAN